MYSGPTVTLKLGATATDGRDVEFTASGTVISHIDQHMRASNPAEPTLRQPR